MLIKLSDDILALTPVVSFATSKNGLEGISAPTGSGTEGMPAAQELIALFKEFQVVLDSYSFLIDHDSKRIAKIVDGFVRSDS